MKTADIFKKNKTVFFLTASALAVMIGCSVSPEPVNDWERAVRVDSDVKEMFAYQRSGVVSKPITLYDAMARALKYNLEARQKLMEQALAQKQYDLTSLDMLPKISAGAGYAGRNNYNASVSKTMKTGVETADSYAFHDKTSATAQLQASWNVLDFGVSYFQAKQNANRVYMAKEERRKLSQSLVQEVREAYWQALAAERLSPRVMELLEEATYALEDAREAEKKYVDNRDVILQYQMTLMEIMRDLSAMEKDLNLARERLSALMNLKPGTRYRLVGAERGNYTLPEIRTNLDRLEWLALMNRPELRAEDYKLKNTRLQAKKSLAALLPGIDISAGANYDGDKFLYNNSWLNAAVRVGWNLLNPLYIQGEISKAQTQEAVDNLRRQTIAMAVMTQVHLAWGQYQGLKETYQLSVEISGVAEKLAENAAEKSTAHRVLPDAERVMSQARALFARMQEAMNFAQFQAATGNIYQTIGLDALPEEMVLDQDLPALSRSLERVMTAWDLGRFTNEDYPVLPPVPMRRPPIAIYKTLPVQVVREDTPFVMDVPKDLFAEAELGDDVVYTAKMRNGSKLVPWLHFETDTATLKLSGTPLPSNEGLYEVKITARSHKLKISAYAIVAIEVLRGYKPIMNLRGAQEGGRALVIERCKGNAKCDDSSLLRPSVTVPGKVETRPAPFVKSTDLKKK